MATLNRHKFTEAMAILQEEGLDRYYSLKNMHDVGFAGDIPEEEDTLEGNATSKSRFVYARFGVNCFSDDTGLEVDAIGGAPGVYSARFAGEDAHAGNNIRKLLGMMEGVKNRKARFRTVISLILSGTEHQFEGVVEGEILAAPEGSDGFGYDPVFRPSGHNRSFATMPSEEKNLISHRYEALRKMADFLRKI